MNDDKIGIYMIRCNINGKVYIGSSVCFTNRFCVHKHDLRLNIHDNDYLQKSWNKYGESNFEFIFLEKCRIEDLLILEKQYIDRYDSMNREKGYNIAYPDRHILSEETKKKIGLGNKGKIRTPEMIEAMRKRLTGCKGHKHSDEFKKNLSLRNVGNQYTKNKKQSPEHIKKRINNMMQTKRLKKQSQVSFYNL